MLTVCHSSRFVTLLLECGAYVIIVGRYPFNDSISHSLSLLTVIAQCAYIYIAIAAQQARVFDGDTRLSPSIAIFTAVSCPNRRRLVRCQQLNLLQVEVSLILSPLVSADLVQCTCNVFLRDIVSIIFAFMMIMMMTMMILIIITSSQRILTKGRITGGGFFTG